MQKSQLNVVRRTEGGTLTSYDGNTTRQEENSIFFPGKDSANEKPWILGLQQPSQLPFPLYKRASLPLPFRGLAGGLPWLQTPIAILCLSSINPIFVREIIGNLFVLGQ